MFAFTVIDGSFTIRSGSPIVHVFPSSQVRGCGMSAGLPRGAPLFAPFAILATSSSVSDGSFLKLWMPMFFSMYHGGMTPACGPMPVRCLMALAYGRTCSYVDSAIGATPSARWQFSQLRCRIGAMSFVYVTCAGPAFD